MEEVAEEDIIYRNATLKDAILALGKQPLMDEINQFAVKNNCKISICHPIKMSEADEIHFSLELINPETITTIFDKADISTHIADSIEYDKVKVYFRRCDQLTFDRFYDDMTLFTPENYENVQKFFQKHYPECYRDTDVDAHLDKKRRSPSPSRYSIFSKKDRSQKGVAETADKIVEHLKDSPLWEEIRRSREVLDEACKRAKCVLNAEQASCIRPTGGVK